MNAFVSFLAAGGLIAIALIGSGMLRLQSLFGVVIPYAAIAAFFAGVVYRVIGWSKSPVPFKITTTCGQQTSLPWIKSNKIDNPSSKLGVIVRMALEVLLFRSLFRNTKAELRTGPKLTYSANKWLWLGGLVFHWSFLIVFLRHYRYFAEPVPGFVKLLQSIDGFFQIGVPIIYITNITLLAALTFLFLRRLFSAQLRYFSLFADYFPLLLIGSIAVTGVLMRYFFKTDIVAVKELAMGLVSFNPVVPDGLGVLFYLHLFLVCVLVAYFPYGKLMHMGGVFLSPTRNMPNDSRSRRHINPWDYPVKVHTYEEWEEEFADKIKASGLPMEKDK